MTTFTRPDERGKAFGIYGGIAGAGASVGLLLGGVLTEYLDWRWTMYVNVLFAVLAAIGALALLEPHAAQTRARIDKTGAVLACASMFAIVYGFAHAATRSGTAGWTDAQTLGFLVAGLILLAAFVAFERRAPYPLLPLRVVADRNRGGAYVAMFLTSIGMFGVFLFVTYYLETTLGYSPVRTGLAFLPLTVAIIVVAAVANTALIPRVSPRILIPFGLLVEAAGMAIVTRIGLHSSYGGTILPPLMLVAIGMGLVFAPSMSLGTSGVAGADAGVASASVNVSQQIGGSIGIATSAAAGYVASHATGAPTRLLLAQAAVHSYDVAFWVCAAIFAGAAVIVAAMLRSGVPD
jgi:MFS transporter